MDNHMNLRASLKKRYTIIRQPASTNLRNIAGILESRTDDRSCVEEITEYLLLCGVYAGGRRP